MKRAAAIQILSAGMIAALVSALAGSLWETVSEFARQGLPWSFTTTVGAWSVSFSLILGALAAWTLALVLPILLLARGDPAAGAHRLVTWVRNAPRARDDDPQRIAAAVSLTLFLACFAATTYAAGSFCIKTFNKPSLVAGAFTGFALATLTGAWLLKRLVYAGMISLGRNRWLSPPLYSFPTVLALGLLSAIVIAGIIVTRWNRWLPGVETRHLLQAGTSFALHLVISVLLLTRGHGGKAVALTDSAGKAGQRQHWWRRGARPAGLALGIAAGGFMLTLGPVGSHPLVRSTYLAFEGQTLIWCDLVRTATDFDGDGHTHFMGGADCAPFNSAIAPGKIDILDNGIDEDCYDGDLRTGRFLTSQDPEWYLGEGLTVRHHNVLLIGGDGINFSRTTMGGNPRNTTPFLDRWSRQHAVVFERAYSVVPYTGFSHQAMFTGVLPLSISELGEGVEDVAILPHHFTTLAQYLKELGYHTSAVDTTVRKWAKWADRGFDDYKYIGNGKAAQVSDAIKTAFKRRDLKTPLFLWGFYFDAHQPYIVDSMEDLPPYGDTPVDEYDTRLLFWDRQLEELFNDLGPALDDTIVIFYSDHGEEVNEEECIGHGKKLTNSHIHVPLIIHAPGIPAGRMSQPVSLIDIFPTVANLVEGTATPNPFEGKSLVGRMVTGVEPEGRLVFSETYRKDVRYAVTDGRFKLLYNLTENESSLFELDSSSVEKSLSAGTHPKVEERLERAVRHYVAGSRGFWRKQILASLVETELPPTMDQPIAKFGVAISLLGAREVHEGKKIFLEVFYRCEEKLGKDYFATTHIIHRKSSKYRNKDHPPVSPVFGTIEWLPGMIYRDRFEFPAKYGALDENDIWIGFHKGKDVLVASSDTLPLREKKVQLGAALLAPGDGIQ
jgi:arylsulfatase A-like enzyme